MILRNAVCLRMKALDPDALPAFSWNRFSSVGLADAFRAAILGSRNRTFSRRISECMAQSAVVKDYRTLETARHRANRLVLTVAG